MDCEIGDRSGGRTVFHSISLFRFYSPFLLFPFCCLFFLCFTGVHSWLFRPLPPSSPSPPSPLRIPSSSPSPRSPITLLPDPHPQLITPSPFPHIPSSPPPPSPSLHPFLPTMGCGCRGNHHVNHVTPTSHAHVCFLVHALAHTFLLGPRAFTYWRSCSRCPVLYLGVGSCVCVWVYVFMYVYVCA